VLLWALPAGPVVLGVLLVGGSFIAPPPHPARLFEAARLVQIPDGNYLMPGFLFLTRHTVEGEKAPAVCVVPGAGDSKIAFKWRLVQALLAQGFTVLTIDPPGHGEYRQRPMRYPDCLSAVPAAVRFLQAQPDVSSIGLLTISMGGALSLKSLAEATPVREAVTAMVVLETPIKLNYSRWLVYQEAWNAFRAPVLSLLREVSARQLRESWFAGGYRSSHTTTDLIALFDPVESIARIKDMPLLLVYSARDCIAPLAAGQALQQAAPGADWLTSKKASHVTLILMPHINRQVAAWLWQQLHCHQL
jgi:pimeloyl-ACP methyl ester carboxylesterase